MTTEFNRERHAMNLPDAYRKDTGSNNHKILEIEKGATDKLREAIRAVYDSLDIDNATGKTLDMYGEMYKLPRGSMTDDQYRLTIKQRIAMNTAGCDHDSIVKALALALGIPAERFHLEETSGGNVKVEEFPYDTLQEAGFTVPQAWQMLESLLPTGVRSYGFNVTHEVDDAALTVTSAVTFAETYTCNVVGEYYESVEAGSVTAASTVTHAENYTMEV